MNLVIVESPTKAKKLSEYLGKGYKVEASMGHIRDLPKSKMGVDLKTFEPEYMKVKGKGALIKKLRSAANDADNIYLAMDPDREGEAIAWHVEYLLTEKSKNKPEKFKRVTFNEITKTAILKSMENPGEMDLKMVDAQQARRVLDRLVGYTLSPVLWKKVRRGLSAGRVQSVALRLIVEKEWEIEKFVPQVYFDVLVSVSNKSEDSFSVNLISIEGKKAPKDGFLITDKTAADVIVSDLKKSDYTVSGIVRRERKRKSYAPFTTSTLQQAAATAFGWSAKQTMATAQKLYEEGLITYHRTDSYNLAKSAIKQARQVIQADYGEEYLPDSPKVYATKSKSAQEAHEAVRPTDISVKEIKASGKVEGRHTKLYSLIWNRTVASQMTDAVYDATTINVLAVNGKKEFGLRISGSIRKFDGWRVLFKKGHEDTILPEVVEGEKLTYKDIISDQKQTQPPPRFNDASLIKALEEKGIGRPSTYAPTISTIIYRGYVERKEKRFYTTSIGVTVIKFLLENFKEIIDYDFTAEMEEDLDRVARGEKKWKPLIKEFFLPFKKTIDNVEKNAERVQIPVEKTDIKCPECKKGMLIIRTGRFGKFYGCDRFQDKEDSCKYTKTFVQKVDDMKCLECEKGDVVVKKTRKGRMFYGCSRYPDCDWASWKKPEKKQEGDESQVDQDVSKKTAKVSK